MGVEAAASVEGDEDEEDEDADIVDIVEEEALKV